jgi:hypothetical protein
MDDPADAVERELAVLDRRLEHVLEPEMRRALVSEWLGGCSPEDACRMTGIALARVRSADPLRRAICEVLTNVPGTRLEYERRRDLYAAAASQENDEIMRLLRSIPAQEELDEPERLLSRELAELPLGRRRSLAKGSHPHWLEQLARDCDPMVIANLLNNSRTVEADVLRIAAMRPVATSSLVEISKNRRWSTRIPVRKALARNPYCPVDIATGIVASLPLEDLRDMRGDPDLHPETEAQLRAELERRSRHPGVQRPL